MTEVDGDEVVVDGNHMLAGQTLTFDVEVVAVREATEEEVQHGHVRKKAAVAATVTTDHDHEGGCCGGEGHDHGEEKKDGCCGGGSCGSH